MHFGHPRLQSVFRFENINGSSASDILHGDAQATDIAGIDGSDALDARAGNDSLTGGVGADTCTGGD